MTSSLPPNWHQYRLCDLGDGSRPAIKAGPFGSSVKKEEYVSEGYKVYGQEQVIRGNIWWGDYYISDKKFNTLKSCAVLPGDLLISLVGTLGKVLLIPEGAPSGIINPRLLRLSFDKSIANPMFIQYLLIDDRTARLLQRRSQGGTMGVLNADIVGTLMVDLPPLPEQRKIAEILSTWDRAIEITDQLIAAKQRRKEALMQRLLTGTVRFGQFVLSSSTSKKKYGHYPDDWEYSPIATVAEQVSSRNSNGDSLPVLSCTKHDGLVDSLKYFGRQIFSEDLSSYKIVKRSQFAYATNHIEEGSIGYQDLYDSALISPMYTSFKAGDRIDDRFLFSLLKTEQYRWIFEIMTSSSVNRRGSLRWAQFARIPIPIPSLAEQSKIAEVLSAADREIEALEQLKTQQQEQKKGLMQQLLTGKTRVKVETTTKGGS